jgi:hypothetical protein
MLTLPPEKLTTKEELQAKEELWSDLSRSQDQVPIPNWHKTYWTGEKINNITHNPGQIASPVRFFRTFSPKTFFYSRDTNYRG